MRLPIPYRDEKTAKGLKRVIWPQGDAQEVYRDVRKRTATLTTKKGKPYSRGDQQKIAREKWGEFCESHPQWPHG